MELALVSLSDGVGLCQEVGRFRYKITFFTAALRLVSGAVSSFGSFFRLWLIGQDFYSKAGSFGSGWIKTGSFGQ